jgi:hypothetical protein
MKNVHFFCLLATFALFYSTVAPATTPNFFTQSGTLRISELIVDGEARFYNVELGLDFATGRFEVKRVSTLKHASAQLGTPFKLVVGQSARLETEGLQILLAGVPADSRCPTDVVCVWAGNVTVVLQVYLDDQDAVDVSLMTDSNSGQGAVEVNGYRLELLNVTPEPISTEQISESDYEITLVVR